MDDFNPHKPGSKEWHRFNLGIKPNELGHIESIEMIPGKGIEVKGWFWDDVPEALSLWYVNSGTMRATSIHGPINTPKKSGLSGFIGRIFRGS